MNLDTPMMQQYLAIKEKTDAILFFRMGDFYEMFLDDAAIASEILEITLTKRNGVPMCGIPYHAKEAYLYKLLKKGKRVAICEQVEDPKLTKKIVKRQIVEIITPGTLVNNEIIDAENPNYIASFYLGKDFYATSHCDVSTGDIFYSAEQNIENSLKAFELIRNELYKVKPKEIIFSDNFLDLKLLDILKSEHQNAIFYPVPEFYFADEYSKKILTDELGVSTLKGFGVKEKTFEIGVLGAIVKYIRDVQLKEIDYIKSIVKLNRQNHLDLCPVAIRNLELLNNLYDGSTNYSLFSVLNSCKTSMGSRLLFEWVKRPLCDAKKIASRLDIVEFFFAEKDVLDGAREILKTIGDIERLSTKIFFLKANPRDLNLLSSSLRGCMKLKLMLTGCDTAPEFLLHLLDKICDLSLLCQRIENTILDEPSSNFDEGGVIREEFSKELDELKEISKKGKNYILELQEKEIKKCGISKLRVKYNKVIGYFIEVPKTQEKNIPDYYMKKQDLVNVTRYTLAELEEYESKILSAKDRITNLEKEIFITLCEHINTCHEQIKITAEAAKKTDILSSFAFNAGKYGYSRPLVTSGCELSIKDGRHPVVEAFIKGEEFVPNDIDMDNSARKLLLITGPNMAGKSTYLRQNALIVIMSQIGSFIPAASAKIGIIDKIFTRIGASDFLVKGESTFLVEMTETAEILNNSTKRSLIIMDEIGRGTSTYDGLSIAWAIVEYLTSDVNKGKTLFATHYHELTALAKERGIENYQVSVKEWDDKILFLHKVIEGAASKSYGIQVARLAGIPEDVTKRAFEILKELENSKDRLETGALLEDRLKDGFSKNQLSLFSTDYERLTGDLLSLNLNKLTPLDALNYLNEIVDKIRKNQI